MGHKQINNSKDRSSLLKTVIIWKIKWSLRVWSRKGNQEMKKQSRTQNPKWSSTINAWFKSANPKLSNAQIPPIRLLRPNSTQLHPKTHNQFSSKRTNKSAQTLRIFCCMRIHTKRLEESWTRKMDLPPLTKTRSEKESWRRFLSPRKNVTIANHPHQCLKKSKWTSTGLNNKI